MKTITTSALGGVSIWALFLSYNIHSYEMWQIAGSGVALIALPILINRISRGFSVAAATLGATLGLWLPWTVRIAVEDETGLYVVGSFLFLLGALVGLTIIFGISRLILED